MATLLHDEQFAGALDDPWPLPWTTVELDAGTGATVDQDGAGDGHIFSGGTAGFYKTLVYLDDVSMDIADQRVYLEFTIHDSTSTQFAGAALRIDKDTAGFSHYMLGCFQSSGDVEPRIWSSDGASLGTALASGTAVTYTAGATYAILAEAEGTALRLKLWNTSGSEPGAWTIDTTDATHIDGHAGVYFGQAVNETNICREMQLHDLAAGLTIAPTGIASGESFGTATLSAVQTLSPTGIPSAEAFGAATLTPGPVGIFPDGIASAEAFGSPTVSSESFIAPDSISTTESFGSHTLLLEAPQTLQLASISTAESFGSMSIPAPPEHVQPVNNAGRHPFAMLSRMAGGR